MGGRNKKEIHKWQKVPCVDLHIDPFPKWNVFAVWIHSAKKWNGFTYIFSS